MNHWSPKIRDLMTIQVRVSVCSSFTICSLNSKDFLKILTLLCHALQYKDTLEAKKAEPFRKWTKNLA